MEEEGNIKIWSWKGLILNENLKIADERRRPKVRRNAESIL